MLGKKLPQHLAERGAQPALYTSDEDLVEQQWTDQEKCRAIRLAPVFVHQRPAATATKCASSFEACRLTLSRLTGDGTEAAQAFEVQDDPRLHIMQCLRVFVCVSCTWYGFLMTGAFWGLRFDLPWSGTYSLGFTVGLSTACLGSGFAANIPVSFGAS